MHMDILLPLWAKGLNYLLLIDLEGEADNLEFPVVMIDARTLEFVKLRNINDDHVQ
ncbi:hypothetical protein GIB67_020569 [Kingdonia uniflora]|uniref:Uncharacterized protein n=1 Tax=Kingdonia uniflora TaxID=39325 RepID=A0A7J7NLA0_9MAGN|nr:hypothetical protein GIB67_020569 [Kingdonia uniflora]